MKWKEDPKGTGCITDSKGNQVAAVARHRREENMPLILTAPQLLKAAEEALRFMAGPTDECAMCGGRAFKKELTYNPKCACYQLRKAIKKAKGVKK